jgi:hypothetical protein
VLQRKRAGVDGGGARFPVYHFNCVPAMDMYYPMLFAFSSISLQLCTGYGYVLSYAFSRFPVYHFNCVPAMSVCYPMLFRVFQHITSIVYRLRICVIICFFAFSSISLQLYSGYECVLSYAFSRFPAYHFNCVPAMSVCYPMLFRVFQCITSIVYRL